MELETCAGFIEANTTDALQNVIICHLSANNAVPEEMVTRIKKVAGMANVDVAEAGKTWQLFNYETCPFL